MQADRSVRSGRIILSPARWRIDYPAIKRLLSTPSDDQRSAVRAMAAELGLPRFVALYAGQTDLTIGR